MSDNNKTSISNLVAEQQIPSSTKDADALARDISKRPVEQVVLNVTSTGNWKYVALINYGIMYFLMVTTIVGDTFGLWNVQIDQVVLATFIGATIGSLIPLYLQFSIGKKSN